jgi:RNA polymerase sigma-70 factor (family 1)
MAPYSSHTDDDLLGLLRNSDQGAFTAIYDKYWHLLLAVAANQLEDVAVAEELVQDIFLDLWQRRATLVLTASLGTYLAVAMKYRVINIQARRRRDREYARYAADHLPHNDQSTQEWLGFEELKDRLALLVSKLPDRCRLTYQLSREEGLSHREIARSLEISEKAVEHNLTRAMKSLRAGLRSMLTMLASVAA